MYTEKIDCFSFGAIIVQILTRQFPKPGDRLQEIELSHPGIRVGTVLVRVPEVECRQNHISQVDPNNSLLLIALNCLKDKDSERPSAHQLCERVADLKAQTNYRDSARTVQDKDEVIQQLRQQLHRANRQLEERVRQLQQENDQALREYITQLQEKERQLGRVNQQLEASEQVVAQFGGRIAELEQQLSQRDQQLTVASSRGKEQTSFKLRWRKEKRAPHAMSRWCDAVVGGNTVFFRYRGTVIVYSYDVTNNSWSQLPDCVYVNGSITIISGWLTTIGGGAFSALSNELYSLTGEGRWMTNFPPMPTKRNHTIAVCTGTSLIVAGGQRELKVIGNKTLSVVEVMNTETYQWSTAADLCQPVYLASARVCGEQLYMLGGEKFVRYPKSVYTCSLSALLQSCVPSPLKARFKNVWKQIADLPVQCSTCESFHGRLLAVGGEMDSGKPTTAVYMYKSTTNSWEIISHMTIGRWNCFTAVLPDSRLLVVGGCTDSGDTDKVEVASVCN